MLDPRKLRLTKLSPELLATFTAEALKMSLPLDGVDFVKKRRAALKPRVEELNMALQRVRVSEYTSVLADLDGQRDALIVGLRAYLHAMILLPMIDKLKADQAAVVERQFKAMDSRVIDLGYLEESAQIRGFLAAAATITGAVDESGAAPIIKALDTVQTKFEQWATNRETSTTVFDDIRQIRVIRKELEEELSSLISFIVTSAKDAPTQFNPVLNSLESIYTTVQAKAQVTATAAETAKAKEAALEING